MPVRPLDRNNASYALFSEFALGTNTVERLPQQTAQVAAFTRRKTLSQRGRLPDFNAGQQARYGLLAR